MASYNLTLSLAEFDNTRTLIQKLTRYVTIELLSALLLTLTAITMFMVLVGVAKEGVREGLGLGPLLQIIPYVLPEALRYSIPATVLLATCGVFGRMAADNEVVALKSLGIWPFSILFPAFTVAFLVSLVAVWINDLAVTWGRPGIHRVIVQSVEQIAYGMLRTQKSYSTKRFSISVKHVDGKKLIRPYLMFHGDDDSPTMTVTAREAELKGNPEENTLTIIVTDGTFQRDDLSGDFPETHKIQVPLLDASRTRSSSNSPSQVPFHKLANECFQMRHRLETLQQDMAVLASFGLTTGDFHALTASDWYTRQAKLVDGRSRLSRLQLEPWRRWANGFSCFFFVLMGAPLAIHLRTANIFTTFGVCFLPILGIYYPLLAFSLDRAKDGALPPFSIWLGNLILMVIGILALKRINRY